MKLSITMAFTFIHYFFLDGHDVQHLGRIEGGSSTTIPFTNKFRHTVEERTPTSEFERPEAISGPIEICSKSGVKPGDDYPEDAITTEIFSQDAVPTETCDLHVEEDFEMRMWSPGYSYRDALRSELFIEIKPRRAARLLPLKQVHQVGILLRALQVPLDRAGAPHPKSDSLSPICPPRSISFGVHNRVVQAYSCIYLP